MAKQVYITCEANGYEGAERVADMYRNKGCDVRIEHDNKIPKWGSGIPTSPNYGRTESGYRIIVEPHKSKR